MWYVQIQTYCKKGAEDGKADRCAKPESPSFFTQQVYLSRIFQGVFGHIAIPLNPVLKFQNQIIKYYEASFNRLHHENQVKV